MNWLGGRREGKKEWVRVRIPEGKVERKKEMGEMRVGKKESVRVRISECMVEGKKRKMNW